MRPSDAYDKALTLLLVEASTTNPDEIKRQKDQLRDMPGTVMRIAALSVHEMVHLIGAERVRKVCDVPYTRAGYEVLGHGFQTTALREPEGIEVRKIVRGSDRLGAAGREDLITELRRKIEANNRFHPETTVPTAVMVSRSPVFDKPVVQITQPFVGTIPEPPNPREVTDFAEKSIEEMIPESWAPDVVGVNNLVNTEDGIKLIDTVAIPEDQQYTFNRCVAHLIQMARTGSL